MRPWAGEPDRHLAALLAAPAQREALVALAAFSSELSKYRSASSMSRPWARSGWSWWRDALAMPAAIRTGHPVADAVREAAHSHELPVGLLEALIDGRSLLLSKGVPLDDGAIDDLLWKTEGALLPWASVWGLPAGADVDTACAASGQAYGMVRLLLGLPRALAQGCVPLSTAQLAAAGLTAEDSLSGAADARIGRLLADCSAQIRRSLATARKYATRLPRADRVAFLPLALVEPYLRAIERTGPALLRQETSVTPLMRVCRIAAAHVFGRL